MILFSILLTILQAVLLLGLAYYYGLLFAAILAPRRRAAAAPASRFAIAIPAHNEEAVIAATVAQLARLDYPRELYDVYIVADYCEDATAQAARAAGAICHERNEGPRGRKAYPLNWLLQRILAEGRPYDAFVVFDADSLVDPGFLRAMDAALQGGDVALQGQHVIANPGDSTFSRLAAVDMRLNNLLRNRAKHNLGLSCRLMGDAMCLSSGLIREHGWGGESLTEDREFEMYLLLHGQRVRYVPDAVSYGQAGVRWKDASRQRVRWYGGVIQMQGRYAWPLLTFGLRARSLPALDRAVELWLPPFSSLAVLALIAAAVQAAWPAPAPLVPLPLAVIMVLAWIAFPFVGLLVDRAPGWTYRAMLYAPFYVVWRLWQGLRATLRRGQVEWVRTRRREEAPRA